jgi:hypothetical protein
MRVRRPHRRGARGQSLVFVALAGVALCGMTGLALDGGYEVGVYRAAQNGADSGALAAARAIYENQANSTYLDGLNNNSGLCGLDPAHHGSKSQLGVAPQQVVLNRTNATPTCTAKTLTTYAPAGPDGFHSYGALATVDSVQGVSGLANLSAHVGINEATANVTDNPTPAANGTVDLASLSASLTAISNSLLSASGSADLYDCSSSASGAGNSQIVPAAGGSCPGNSLALNLALTILLVTLNINVDTQLGLSGNIGNSPASISLVKQALSSVVPSTGKTAQQRDFTQVAAAALGILGLTINANVGSTQTVTGNLGGNATGSQTDVNIANLTASIGGATINLNALNAEAKVSYDPVNGFQAVTSCSYLSGNGTAQAQVGSAASGTSTLSIASDCSYTPISIPGVLTVGPTKSVNCQTGTYGKVCTASVCLLDINVLSLLSGVSSIDVCLGKAQASADFTPQTSTGGIIVTSQIPTPTFFLGVVGAKSTNPEAEAAATVRQVTDVDSAAFAAAPYAVSYNATEKSGGASYCTGAYGPLVGGCNYTVWGSGIDNNTIMNQQLGCSNGSNCWQGQLDTTTTTNHAVGSKVHAKSGPGTGPAAVISGSRYLLLPVIDDSGRVQEYGLFAPTNDSHIFTLARTPDPTTNPNATVAPTAQSTTTGSWMPNDEGAVSIKLVDPSYFNASGWS